MEKYSRAKDPLSLCPARKQKALSCLSTSPGGEVFESGLMWEGVGPSEEGKMLEGPLGHPVHPLPPGESATAVHHQVPREKLLYFLSL